MTLTSIENIENLSIRDNKVIEKKDITNGQKQKTEEKQDEQIEPLLKVSMAIFILFLALTSIF